MDSYTMHRSYVAAAAALGGDAEELEFRRMIDRYALEGQEPAKGHRFYPLFTLLKPNLDSSCKKRISGAAGGANRWRKPGQQETGAEAQSVGSAPEKVTQGGEKAVVEAGAASNPIVANDRQQENSVKNGTLEVLVSTLEVPVSTLQVPLSTAIANRKGKGRGIEREEEEEGECEGKGSGKTSLPSPSASSLGFDRETVRITGVTDGDMERWRRAYPCVDPADELARMAQWLYDNPRRVKRDYRRFAGNWMADENRRRESRGAGAGGRRAVDGGQRPEDGGRRIGETGGLFV
jgi:hypothetical protein